jgi:hypothetical protein
MDGALPRERLPPGWFAVEPDCGYAYIAARVKLTLACLPPRRHLWHEGFVEESY